MHAWPAHWFSLIVILSQAHRDSYIKVPLKYELLEYGRMHFSSYIGTRCAICTVILTRIMESQLLTP